MHGEALVHFLKAKFELANVLESKRLEYIFLVE